MKRCRKLPEPCTLTTYRDACPDSSWKEMRNDPSHGGQQAYVDIKKTLVRGQRCLCAFCETQIADGTDDKALYQKSHLQRVEHFHSKSDHSDTTNWAFVWDNVWAVCLGGERDSDPRPENLSCDAFKGHQIRKRKLPIALEGRILTPDDIPAFPPLFQFSSLNGALEPNLANCERVTILNNRYASTEELVSKTIEHLNLNCPRLNRNRTAIMDQIIKEDIPAAVAESPDVDERIVWLDLARLWFPQDETTPWPEFFSLIRWILGAAAEARLREIEYDG